MKDILIIQADEKFCRRHNFKNNDLIKASYDPKKSIIQLVEVKKNLN